MSVYITVTSGGGYTTTTRVITYTYDPLSRLVGADYSTGESFEYTYDAVGNRTAMTTTERTTTYTYDAANRLTSTGGVAYTWDDRGNLTSDSVFTYTYNAAGRMVRAESVTSTLVYTYNHSGLRVAQSVQSVPESVDSFAWDWASGLPEMLSEGASVYLAGHDTLARWDGSDWAYYLPDALGSVRQVADGAGTVVSAREWSPYGVEVGGAQAGLGYAGEWFDSSAALLYLRARWYDGTTGRFTQKDPWEGEYQQPQTLNGYIYVTNCPIVLLDPSGLQVCGSCCGPDITDWFAEEFRIHWNWVQVEKSAFDAETMRLRDQCIRTSPSPQYCANIAIGRTEEWLLSFADYAKAIPYKWMRFRHLVPDCPSFDCWFTVTLCDTCINRSELGNIMFGFTAKPWGWPAGLTHLGAVSVGALKEEWDKAAAGIGYYFAEEYIDSGVPDSGEMCSSMKASEGSFAFPQARWENIQDPLRTEGCQPCGTPVPLSTLHSTPAFADAPAGYSYPWAGAPDYVYYTEQMPAGMLDPLMLVPPLPIILR